MIFFWSLQLKKTGTSFIVAQLVEEHLFGVMCAQAVWFLQQFLQVPC